MKQPRLLTVQYVIVALCCAMIAPACYSLTTLPELFFPKQGISKEQLGIVINGADPMSRLIGRYYQQARNIPDSNVVYIHIPNSNKLSPFRFKRAKQRIEEQLPDNIQALALAWNSPYRVGCMSATAAFSLGYDTAYCAEGCKPTKSSPYFNSTTATPLQQFHLRPSMMLAGSDFASAKAMIDRGISSDNNQNNGEAWLMQTSDPNRTVRQQRFTLAEQRLGYRLPVHIEQADSLRNKDNVMFYFTGLTRVADIDTNHYLPGAVGDHLTSFGGMLTDSRQMSAMQWIDAGLTGSYGTVTEPCNFLQKFPDPLTMIEHYMTGETLVEAYWKSVLWPGQGVFIGEPLARPYSGYQISRKEGGFDVRPARLLPGLYQIKASNKQNGPFVRSQEPILIQPQTLRFTLLDRGYRYYQLSRYDQSH
ncbi:uncharacterized protein (TIGR03790 family) [Sinobacterium caligoides]|uniref:Uncharacterized protein (TIGR03790 family) n=1 Tax=Sinobacterium caligoides TaxID=933926 RepID=A0A3N2DXS7_9GAMM|nr:TIGR03790 family protein [Sinobacterium caligoides]ROS04633.1 uncharacterized protein (TIGR03790 family) [Sinobacterium caligoides]